MLNSCILNNKKYTLQIKDDKLYKYKAKLLKLWKIMENMITPKTHDITKLKKEEKC